MSSPLTYADLVKPMTKDEIMEEVALPIFEAYDFPVDAFGPTDEPIADIEVQCTTLAGLSTTVSETAKGATLDGEGDWLTLKADQDFGLDRKPATATAGSVTFVDSSGSGHTIADGQIYIVDKNDPDTVYTVPAFTVPVLGTSAPVAIKAEKTGSVYNKQGGDLQIGVSVPGLTLVAAPGQAWITSPGTDLESDDALRLRCRVARAALSPDDDVENFTGPDDAYVRWALAASIKVNRVHVQEDPIAVPPALPVRIYVAGNTGPIDGTELTAVNAYIQARRPLGIEVGVYNCSTWVCTVRGTYYVKAASLAAAQTKINTQLDKFFAGESIKIRDSDTTSLPGLGIGKRVLVSQVVEIIMAVDGVDDVVLTDGAGTPLATGAYIGGTPDGDAVALLERSLLLPSAVS